VLEVCRDVGRGVGAGILVGQVAECHPYQPRAGAIANPRPVELRAVSNLLLGDIQARQAQRLIPQDATDTDALGGSGPVGGVQVHVGDLLEVVGRREARAKVARTLVQDGAVGLVPAGVAGLDEPDVRDARVEYQRPRLLSNGDDYEENFFLEDGLERCRVCVLAGAESTTRACRPVSGSPGKAKSVRLPRLLQTAVSDRAGVPLCEYCRRSSQKEKEVETHIGKG
jgi:hypothetical protein